MVKNRLQLNTCNLQRREHGHTLWHFNIFTALYCFSSPTSQAYKERAQSMEHRDIQDVLLIQQMLRMKKALPLAISAEGRSVS